MGRGRRGCSHRRRRSRRGRRRRLGRSPRRFPFRRSLRLRHLTRLSRSTSASGASATARGARVIATASPRKAERVRGYGATEVLDYHDDWPTLVREITGGGAQKAVNAAPAQAKTTL